MTAPPTARLRHIGDPLVRPLGAATVCIVAAFVGVSVVSATHLRELDRTARRLATDIAPSIECLTSTRGALHELGRALDDERRPAELARRRARLQDEVRRCAVARSLPDVAAWLTRPAAADGELRAAVERSDEAIEHAVQTEAAAAAGVGRALGDERARTWRASVAVYSLAAFVALFAVGIVWLASRSQARLALARASLEAHQRRVALERARELDLFASRAAHDLKAPLSAVLLYLRASAPRPPTREAWSTIEESVAGAIDVVDALLDYARATGQSAPSAPTGVREIVDHVVRSLAPTWRHAGVDVTVEVPADVAVACSRGALTSILANLLRNAFEHGVPAGARHVTLRAEARAGRVRVEVADDGPGVSPALRARLFQPYVRGEAHGRAGLGLGLATVRRFAEGCGGAAGVDNPPEGGARFWVELPGARAR